MPFCLGNGEREGAHGQPYPPLGDMEFHQLHQSVVAPGDAGFVKEESWSQESSAYSGTRQ